MSGCLTIPELASNFSSFLDKLLVMFQKISDRLPGYVEYYKRILTAKYSLSETQVFRNSRALES